MVPLLERAALAVDDHSVVVDFVFDRDVEPSVDLVFVLGLDYVVGSSDPLAGHVRVSEPPGSAGYYPELLPVHTGVPMSMDGFGERPPNITIDGTLVTVRYDRAEVPGLEVPFRWGVHAEVRTQVIEGEASLTSGGRSYNEYLVGRCPDVDVFRSHGGGGSYMELPVAGSSRDADSRDEVPAGDGGVASAEVAQQVCEGVERGVGRPGAALCVLFVLEGAEEVTGVGYLPVWPGLTCADVAHGRLPAKGDRALSLWGRDHGTAIFDEDGNFGLVLKFVNVELEDFHGPGRYTEPDDDAENSFDVSLMVDDVLGERTGYSRWHGPGDEDYPFSAELDLGEDGSGSVVLRNLFGDEGHLTVKADWTCDD